VDRGAFFIPALVADSLAAVGASEYLTKPAPPDGKVHVVYWEEWTDFEFTAMKDVVDSFNKSQDKIQVDILSISGIDDKTLMAVSGKMPPDVAGLYGANVTQYADDKAVIPLDDLCRESGIKEDQYVPAFWDICKTRGHMYALPSCPASVAIHWNTEMFKQAGLDPTKPPKTWGEVFEMAKKITKKDANGHMTISGFLPAEPGWWSWMWGPLFGGKLWDGKDKITCNDEGHIHAYDWIQSFSKEFGGANLASTKSGFGTFSSPQNGFLAGKLAMEPQGVWMYNFISKFAPNLKWAAAPLPAPDDRPDLGDATIVDLDVLCIPTGAKHPKEGFEFIKYVESQKGMEMLCLGQRKASPLRAVSDDFYKKHPNPFIKLFADMAYSKNAVAVPKLGIWPEYQAEINSMYDEVSLMQKTPKQALDDLQKRMQPKLDQYLRRLKERGEN